jgi:hypothetical protein
VIDEKSGRVVAIANYRMGGTKGVAISIETIEKIRPTIRDEIRIDVVNRFWWSLIAGGGVDPMWSLRPVNRADMPQFDVSPQARFTLLGTSSLAPHHVITGGWNIFAMAEADGLTERDFDALLNKLFENMSLLKPSPLLGFSLPLGPLPFAYYYALNVYFLSLDGLPHELRYFFAERLKSLKDRFKKSLNSMKLGRPSVYLWVFDFQDEQVYRVPEEAVETAHSDHYHTVFDTMRLQYPF